MHMPRCALCCLREWERGLMAGDHKNLFWMLFPTFSCYKAPNLFKSNSFKMSGAFLVVVQIISCPVFDMLLFWRIVHVAEFVTRSVILLSASETKIFHIRVLMCDRDRPSWFWTDVKSLHDHKVETWKCLRVGCGGVIPLIREPLCAPGSSAAVWEALLREPGG